MRLAFTTCVTPKECVQIMHPLLKLQTWFSFSLPLSLTCSLQTHPWSFSVLALSAWTGGHVYAPPVFICPSHSQPSHQNMWLLHSVALKRSNHEIVPSLSLCFCLPLLCWCCVFFVYACIMSLSLLVYVKRNAIKITLCNPPGIMGLFLSGQQTSSVHK